MDAAPDCMAAAIAGECTTNAGYMSVHCKASCGLCGIQLGSASADAFDEDSLGRVPLLFSGQQVSSGDEPVFGELAEDMAVFVGGDIRIALTQPTLADRCCWGANAMVRYETSGSLSVPEDGIVVFRFAGQEADVMPWARGEFQAFVQAPGRYPLQVAIESHDRLQRLAVTEAELLVTAEGPMLVSVDEPERQFGATGLKDKHGGRHPTQLLYHALRPHPNASCTVHCISSEELDEMRADVAHRLFERDQSAGAKSSSEDQAAAATTNEGVTFVLQIGA